MYYALLLVIFNYKASTVRIKMFSYAVKFQAFDMKYNKRILSVIMNLNRMNYFQLSPKHYFKIFQDELTNSFII